RVVERVVVRAEVVVAVADEGALAAAPHDGGHGEQERQPGEGAGREAAHAFETWGSGRGGRERRVSVRWSSNRDRRAHGNAAGTAWHDTELAAAPRGYCQRTAGGAQAAPRAAPPTPTPHRGCSRGPCW